MINLIKSVLIFLVFLVAGGLWCAYTEQELWWDFANYHYYNAWAFIHNKTFTNIAPAGVHSFFNPLLDLYTYGAIVLFNDTPKMIFFCQGLWTGFLCYLLYRTILLILPHQTIGDKFACVVAFFFSILGYATFRQMGTSTNEITIACLFLWGLYLFLQVFLSHQFKIQKLFWAGLLFGMAGGLKMTVAPFVVAVGLSALIFYRQFDQPIKTYFVLGISGLLGYLITNGFWMTLLYHYYQNPFFPFFNNIFKSEYALSVAISDPQFIPKTFGEFITFPFKLAQYNKLGTDLYTNNFNIPLGLFSSIILLCQKKSGIILKFLSVFFVIGYMIWIISISVVRYTIPLEFISGILIVAVCLSLKNYFKIPFLLLILLSNILAATYYEVWYNVPLTKYIKTTPLALSDNTILILLGRTNSFFVPGIKGGVLVVGIEQSWNNQKETDISASGTMGKLFLPYILDPKNRFAILSRGMHNAYAIHNNIFDLYNTPFYIYPPPNKDGIIEGITFDELRKITSLKKIS